MTDLRYTLLGDGASDKVLLPVLDWLLANHAAVPFTRQWADLQRLLDPPVGLEQRVLRAFEIYPCNLLFVHRDAERAPRAARIAEIHAVLQPQPPAVCVVPVRMQEAWFLFNEPALREAAGRPASRNALNLPPLRRTEAIPDPKSVLHNALLAASGLHGRRRRLFPVRARVHRLADLIQDFAPLRALPAFAALEADVRAILLAHGWA